MGCDKGIQRTITAKEERRAISQCALCAGTKWKEFAFYGRMKVIVVVHLCQHKSHFVQRSLQFVCMPIYDSTSPPGLFLSSSPSSQLSILFLSNPNNSIPKQTKHQD